MPIGEFGRPPQLPEETGGPVLSTPLYWFYEWGQAALNPSRAFAEASRLFFKNPANPLSYTSFGKTMAASFELFERLARHLIGRRRAGDADRRHLLPHLR